MPKINVTELKGTPHDDSDASSDSDQEQKISKRAEAKRANRSVTPGKNREQIIAEINQKLERGERVDLSKYPPLFIVHFRGTHFFTQFFDQPTRRKVRAKIKKDQFKESMYSPAVYELAGLKLGETIDTPEKKAKIRAAKAQIKHGFQQLSSNVPRQFTWYGNKRRHVSELHQHYQRYVNEYGLFREESGAGSYLCYTVLPSKQNPYVSAADEARHAIFYALGGKSEITHGSLRPAYLKDGRAKHPKVGYVQIIFHCLQNIGKHDPLFLSVLHAGDKVDIKDRNLNERETTFKGWITAKHVVHTQEVRFPSFNKKYTQAFHAEKYGIHASNSYSRYRNTLTGTTPTKETGLLDSLTEHYEKQLNAKAEQIAEEQGGFIVYLGLDGRLRSTLPTTQDVRSERSRGILANNPMFANNLARFSEAKEPDTDSDEEFPLLKKDKHLSQQRELTDDLAALSLDSRPGKENKEEALDTLGGNGNNPYYWYSMDDGYRLLIDIRRRKLRYSNNILNADLYGCLRENDDHIFISDPYRADFIASAFMDDLRSIIGKHTEPARNHLQWRYAPTTIIIPFLAGLHWRVVRIQIDYHRRSVDILYDDPYGGESFTEQLRQSVYNAIWQGVSLLFREVCNYSGNLSLTEQRKFIDQQGHGNNSVDCGPITFCNVADYTSNRVNSEFVAVNTPHFTINSATANNHAQTIRQIRENDANVYNQLQAVVIGNNATIQQMNQKSKERQDKNINKNDSVLQDLIRMISLNFTPQQISAVYDYIDNQRILKGTDLNGHYQIAELQEAFEWVKQNVVSLALTSTADTLQPSLAVRPQL